MSATTRDLPRINPRSRSLIMQRRSDHPTAKMAENIGKGRIFPSRCQFYANLYADDRAIVWFDIDNTLYSASTKISQAMGKRIHGSLFGALKRALQRGLIPILAYFVQLGLSHEEASGLHHHYYKTYGLALRGLVMHHDVGEPTF